MRVSGRARATMAALAAHGLVGSGRTLPGIPLGPGEWRALLDEVLDQRLTGFLIWAIRDGALATTPGQCREAVEAHARARWFVLLLEELLVEFVDRLEAAGIPSRVLKGPAAAHLIHRDPEVRTYGDIDLLIPERHIDATVKLLADMGYRRDRPEPRPGFDRRFGKGVTLRTPGGYPVDLHRTLAAGPFAQRIRQRDLFVTSSSFQLRGRRLRALSAEERFLHACLHAVLEAAPPGLVSLRDLAQMAMTTDLDMTRVQHLCGSWGAGAAVASAVQSAWSAFQLNEERPISVWACRNRPTRSEARTLRRYPQAPDGYPIMALTELPAVPGVRAKVSYLRAMLTPDRDYLDARCERHVGRWIRAARTVLDRRRVR